MGSKILIASVPFFLLQCNLQADSTLTSSMDRFPANGVSGGRVALVKGLLKRQDYILPLTPEDASHIQIYKQEKSGNRLVLFFHSTKKPGKVTLYTASGKSLDLSFYSDEGDLDGDGFPDKSELKDADNRNRFVAWFVRIAESQYLKKNHSWNPDERDCAGLIRYAYREALKIHDSKWQKTSGVVLDKNLADLDIFNYPEIPLLGKRIFRISEKPGISGESFGEYADAEHLMKYHTGFVSRSLAEAKPGDILFFFDPENESSPYHSMIVTQTRDQVMLLYHTGSDAGIKRIRAEELEQTNRFSLSVANKNFIGVFRFHILD